MGITPTNNKKAPKIERYGGFNLIAPFYAKISVVKL
jgi:hypothetical protein